ncbi:hypothetical protein L332_11850 [Agrococcus pavilionensis RW1]|uniref:Uncharacterized protein n=1 Tax=Agrococcus pavilionensis RW1 TaxID=1330458 RepID=U1LRK7_9MICO|nr:hypothetical protein [Agrococcus pavilionensis]ERG65129.1 hypothetical protein L332_11850 [Agrococcus pavilionensis RW1]
MSFAARRRPAVPAEPHSARARDREAAPSPSGEATPFVDELDPDTLTPAQSRSLRRALDDLAAQRHTRHGR